MYSYIAAKLVATAVLWECEGLLKFKKSNILTAKVKSRHF